jgi:hypothetical protein
VQLAASNFAGAQAVRSIAAVAATAAKLSPRLRFLFMFSPFRMEACSGEYSCSLGKSIASNGKKETPITRHFNEFNRPKAKDK